MGVVRPGELVQQAGLAHARLPHAGHHLPLPSSGACQGLAQVLQLRIAPHKARQPRATAACNRERTGPARNSS